MLLGGYGASTDVSLFFPATNATCRGPDLPDYRASHSAGEITYYLRAAQLCLPLQTFKGTAAF